MAEIFVVRTADFANGERRILKTPRGEIGVFAHEGAYYAYANHCAHTDGPVCEGILIPKVLEVLNDDKTYVGHVFSDEMNLVCPWHGWEYDLKSGACIGAKQFSLRKYETVVRDGDLYVVA